MKKIILFSAVALWMLALGGCSKDKSTPELKASIIGTWKCIGFGTTDNDKIKEIKPKDCTECYTINI